MLLLDVFCSDGHARYTSFMLTFMPNDARDVHRRLSYLQDCIASRGMHGLVGVGPPLSLCHVSQTDVLLCFVLLWIRMSDHLSAAVGCTIFLIDPRNTSHI